MLTVTYDELAEALTASSAPAGAAEAHGSLCGALAAAGRFDAETWVGGILPDDRGGSDTLRTRNLLATLIEETQVALTSQDMEFEPLLPGDDEPLPRRVEALAEWCAGFLYGVGTGGLSPDDGAVPEAVHEVVRDFGEISRASIDAEESEESNEASYAEIVEYLRAGTQLAYEELEAYRAGGPR
jgi:uncharacterized protein YgfB (UPF0149 family)